MNRPDDTASFVEGESIASSPHLSGEHQGATRIDATRSIAAAVFGE